MGDAKDPSIAASGDSDVTKSIKDSSWISRQQSAVPLGHRNLAIRGGVAFSQGFLTMVLIAYDVAIPQAVPTAVCQFCASATLFIQWRTANPYMFFGRAAASYARCLIVLHASICGRKWLGGDCIDEAWGDVRWSFRLLHVIASVRFFLNGLSLTFQYFLPKRGVGIRGNEQLFYRGCIRLVGVPLHFTRAMLKLGELTGTKWERLPIEILVNFLRCFVLIPIASWSLFDQWMLSGSGRQTDDYRTSKMGQKVFSAADSFGDYFDLHQGHRNLLIRSAMALVQAIVTFWLVAYDIDVSHKLPLAIFQLGSSFALLLHWYKELTSMFLVRALLSFARTLSLLHQAFCGRVWLWESCGEDGWRDARRPFRMLHIFAAVRMLLIGLSLVAHWLFPERGVTSRHGNEQLYLRAILRGIGTPLYLARAVQKFFGLTGTEYERSAVEIVTDLIRALVIIPIQTWSLLHQWKHTGKAADKYGDYVHKNTVLGPATPKENEPPHCIPADQNSLPGMPAVADLFHPKTHPDRPKDEVSSPGMSAGESVLS